MFSFIELFKNRVQKWDIYIYIYIYIYIWIWVLEFPPNQLCNSKYLKKTQRVICYVRTKLLQRIPYYSNIPSQEGEWILWIPILWKRNLNCFGKSGLVRKSIIWFWEETWSVLRQPTYIFSQTRWQTISVCLVCSWNTNWLQYGGLLHYHIIKLLVACVQFQSLEVEIMTTQVHKSHLPLLYFFASTDDRDIVFFF